MTKEVMNWNNKIGGKKAERIPCPDGIEGCLVAHYKVIEEQTNQEQGEHVVGTKTWFEDDKFVTQNLYYSDVYTKPQQRKPLTDEQILHIVSTHVGEISPSYPLDNSDWINFAHAIESAHGIKE